MKINSNGYEYVRIKDHPLAQKSGVVAVHRKVWFDEYGPIPNKMLVHHKNGDRLDNRIENLEIVTKSVHGKCHYPEMSGLNKGVGFGESHPNAKLTEHQVKMILRRRGKDTATKLAEIYNISRSNITMIWSGRKWSYLRKEARDGQQG